MTPTEVLNEISRMPVAERRRILEELTKADDSPTLSATKERVFLERMIARGLILPTQLERPARKRPAKFTPIKISGEPISETIIRERR